MRKLIEQTVNNLIKIIDSKKQNQKVALQFVLEELDAARSGIDFVKDRIKSLYFNEREYVDAMTRSWEDVDGEHGPQQFLLRTTFQIKEHYGSDIAAKARISITEHIAQHYGLGRFYINKEIRTASKPLDLFKNIIQDESKIHPHFKHLMEVENKPIRDVISRWASGFEDRDNKFTHEFQTTFNSSFWEVYLYQCFIDLKMTVDFSESAPDFTVKTKNLNIINIEAVTANHANSSPPEWIHKELKSNIDFLNFSCIRVLNAIDSKHKKFIESYSKLAHTKDKPFVIAVAPFEQSMFFIQNNEAIIRVLYGKGIDKHNGFIEVDVPTVSKNENTSLDLGIFTTPKYKEISAVIFSTTATIGKAITQTDLPKSIRCSRYHERHGLIMELNNNSKHFETHLDGLQVHHNPYATNKLPPESFDKYEITHYHYDTDLKAIDNQQKSYTLISRNIFPIT